MSKKKPTAEEIMLRRKWSPVWMPSDGATPGGWVACTADGIFMRIKAIMENGSRYATPLEALQVADEWWKANRGGE